MTEPVVIEQTAKRRSGLPFDRLRTALVSEWSTPWIAGFARPSTGNRLATSSRAGLWFVALALSVGDAAAVHALGWAIDWPEAREIIVGAILILGLAQVCRQRLPALERFAHATALAIVLGGASQVATYIVARYGPPFRSGWLTTADAALGFHWPVWVAWVHTRPALAETFALVYPTHILGAWVVVSVLAFWRPGAAERFFVAFLAAFAVSIVGLLLMPALTNTPAAPSNVVRLALRDGSFDGATFAQGLISFPSMHAALAVLMGVGLWPIVRRGRPLLVAFVVLMLLATPSEGGHYLIDVVAGAILGWWAARVAGMPTR